MKNRCHAAYPPCLIKYHRSSRLQWLCSQEERRLAGQLPECSSVQLVKEQIPKLIGVGGAVIKGIEASTGCILVLQDAVGASSARMHYFAPNKAALEAVQEAIGNTLGTSIKVCGALLCQCRGCEKLAACSCIAAS